MKKQIKFQKWIDELREEVIQEEYGYEEGEFTVYPEQWRFYFDFGLTPSQAFARALKAHTDSYTIFEKTLNEPDIG